MKCAECGGKMVLHTYESGGRSDPCMRCIICNTNWYSEIVWELVCHGFTRRHYGDKYVLKEGPEWTTNVDTAAEGN